MNINAKSTTEAAAKRGAAVAAVYSREAVVTQYVLCSVNLQDLDERSTGSEVIWLVYVLYTQH